MKGAKCSQQAQKVKHQHHLEMRHLRAAPKNPHLHFQVAPLHTWILKERKYLKLIMAAKWCWLKWEASGNDQTFQVTQSSKLKMRDSLNICSASKIIILQEKEKKYYMYILKNKAVKRTVRKPHLICMLFSLNFVENNAICIIWN